MYNCGQEFPNTRATFCTYRFCPPVGCPSDAHSEHVYNWCPDCLFPYGSVRWGLFTIILIADLGLAALTYTLIFGNSINGFAGRFITSVLFVVRGTPDSTLGIALTMKFTQ